MMKDKFWKNLIEIAKFIDWVEDNYIDDDLNLLTPIGKVIFFLPYIINKSLIYLVSPLLIPYYILIHSTWYKDRVEEYENMLRQINSEK